MSHFQAESYSRLLCHLIINHEKNHSRLSSYITSIYIIRHLQRLRQLTYIE